MGTDEVNSKWMLTLGFGSGLLLGTLMAAGSLWFVYQHANALEANPEIPKKRSSRPSSRCTTCTLTPSHDHKVVTEWSRHCSSDLADQKLSRQHGVVACRLKTRRNDGEPSHGGANGTRSPNGRLHSATQERSAPRGRQEEVCAMYPLARCIKMWKRNAPQTLCSGFIATASGIMPLFVFLSAVVL